MDAIICLVGAIWAYAVFLSIVWAIAEEEPLSPMEWSRGQDQQDQAAGSGEDVRPDAGAGQKEGVMSYQIQCQKCGAETWAGNIADLIDACTDATGRLVCSACGKTQTYIHRITGRWEKEPEEVWDEYIKGVVRVRGSSPDYFPYAFLTARSPDGEVSGVRLSFYRAPGPSGRLTDGPGPGGAPRLGQEELFQLLERLGAFGLLHGCDLEELASRLRSRAVAPALVAGC